MTSASATIEFSPYNKSDFVFASIPASYMNMKCDMNSCTNTQCSDVTADYSGSSCSSSSTCITEYKKQVCLNKILYNQFANSEIKEVGTSSGRYADLYNLYNQDVSQMISTVICIGILLGVINYV